MNVPVNPEISLGEISLINKGTTAEFTPTIIPHKNLANAPIQKFFIKNNKVPAIPIKSAIIKSYLRPIFSNKLLEIKDPKAAPKGTKEVNIPCKTFRFYLSYMPYKYYNLLKDIFVTPKLYPKKKDPSVADITMKIIF